MEIIRWFESQNLCLGKLIELSDQHLRELGDPDWEDFTKRRNSLFKMFQFLDRKINEASVAIFDNPGPLSGGESRRGLPRLDENGAQQFVAKREVLRKLWAKKNELIQAVLKKDEELISAIAEERRELFGEISRSNRSIQTVSKFRSGWINESGENFDGKC